MLLTAGCSSGAAGAVDKAPGKTDKSKKAAPAAQPKIITLDLGKGVKMKLALVPAGEFMMGSKFSPAESAKKFEGKDSNYASEHPEPWKGKMLTKLGPDHPASWVHWNEANEFCRKLSKTLGRKVSLPTEAQWEYACRAGTDTAFCFGDDPSKLSDYGWWRGNMRDNDKGKSYARKIGGKKPNAWGLYDMHGNVWEWCSDWFDRDFYAGGNKVDPENTKESKNPNVRGGSWYNDPCHLRSAARNSWCAPKYRHYNYGFRVIAK
jgi:formylglycine-generating enzyme required for sulfatase activity